MPKKANQHSASSTLPEAGINHTQSSRWQRVASLPEADFEAYVAECVRRTTVGIYPVAGDRPGEPGRQQRSPRCVHMAEPACAGLCDLFFAFDDDSKDAAKAICAGCPYRRRCLARAQSLGVRHGIWAGVDFAEREAA